MWTAHGDPMRAGSPFGMLAQMLRREAGLGDEARLAAVGAATFLESYAGMLSADDIFFASAVIFLLLIPLVWMSRPRKGAGADAGGAH